MPEFEDFRTALNQARSQKQQAHIDLFKSQERQQQIQAELDRLAQIFDSQNREHVARQQSLNRAAIAARGTVQTNQERYDRYADLEVSSFERFKPLLLDPRQQVEHLSDDYPVLLLPLRLETRFKTIPSSTANAPRTELWVRVYPDDCAIDTFEPLLSQSELKNAQTYWTQSWQAEGREDQERAAWRGLVSSHGSGRARWILENYRPTNLDQKTDASEQIILTIPTEELPLEVNALQAYWESVWRLNGETEQARNALIRAIGSERSQVLIKQYVPNNLDVTPQPPLTKENASVTVDFVVFPRAEEVGVKQNSWSQAPKTTILPDCLVLIAQVGDISFEQVGRPIPSPLVVGPDPNAPPEQQLRQENGELLVSDEMRWMVDFERAVEWGMGFKVPLDAEQARNGLDRLMVLGLKLSADEKAGQTQLETLLQHHHWGRSGLSVLPQGTPTNNTDQIGASFSRAEDADASYESVFGTPSTDDPFAETDAFRKRDGQWLAEALGINPQILRTVPNSDRTDQKEARAMNTALWSATLGYSLETMLHPVLSDSAVDDTRWFFNRFVSGRGSIPAIRIGRQPYGILPTTAFSKIQWVSPDRLPKLLGNSQLEISRTFLSRLHEILQLMDDDWAGQLSKVSWVGKPGDAHKTLLDVIGLHASSVEYYQRYAESLQHLFNRVNLQGFGGTLLAALIAAGYTQSGLDLLRKLGYRGEQTPDVLQKFFLSSENLMKGPVIDDRPLSEEELIRGYTTDGKNYIQWLREAAATSLETLRQQQGFIDNKAPNALLYLFLRHSLLLGYWDVSWQLHRGAEVLSANALSQLRREPNFVHVKTQENTSESRWQLLYKPEARITGSSDRTVADFIPEAISRFTFEARYLNEQLRALEQLQDIPTARLERLFAEHIDCCTYRLDAWKLGLVNFQWMAMRGQSAPTPTPTPTPDPIPVPRLQQEAVVTRPSTRRGIYLGAYGWLENVRPENKVLTPKPLTPELAKIFDPAPIQQPPVTAPQRRAPAARVVSRAPILQDNQNAGYIHAPSLNHAVTAAVLRNGYLSTARPNHRKSLAVNLSSERVRIALAVLEGIREGQSLGALLGYQLERGLHDRHTVAEVDQFILKLRKAFPLRADRLSPTRTNPTVPIEAVEARNVLDGLSLVNHVKRQTNPAQRVYPFGKSLPTATPAQATAINAEVDRLLNLHDAIADLALAEGVHQAVQGNYDRAAATLDTYSKGNFPPEPEVVQTPRSGITLTHRVGLQFQPGLGNTSPVLGLSITPRAQAEPALNHWLAQVIPEPNRVACRITYRHPVTDVESAPILVTQQELGLQPIDLLYLNQTDSQAGMGELDDRLRRWLFASTPLRPDTPITLHYAARLENHVSFFELSALLQHLRSLLLRSQPLKASDISPPTTTQSTIQSTVFDQRPRLEPLVTALQTELTSQLLPFRDLLQGLIDDPAANRTQILNQIDDHLNTFVVRMVALSAYGLPQTGWGIAYDQKRQIFESILAQVKELVNRWQDRQQQFTLQLTAYDALPPETFDRDRTDALIALERLVASTPSANPPADFADYRSAIINQSTLFVNQLSSFQATLATNEVNLAPLLSSLQVSIVDFDILPLDFSAPEQQIIALTQDLLRIVTTIAQEIVLRLQTIQTQFTTHDNNLDPQTRLTAIQTAAGALFGDDFKLIPEFTLAPDPGASWQKAMSASQDQSLFNHLSTAGVDFPVDDWLYGIARVREKMHHWEQLVMLSGAFGKSEPELQPIQLPYKPGDPWLALQFPENFQLGEQLKGDRLLYTAYYTVPFNPNQRQCGLLLDEWTEVIPGETETTGIAFHYDRPNCEPPQTWLLVTPPRAAGTWAWSDLTIALSETLEMAKKRAVEPSQLDDTAYARFLPATIMAVTLYQISISANLALNNKVYDTLLNPNP